MVTDLYFESTWNTFNTHGAGIQELGWQVFPSLCLLKRMVAFFALKMSNKFEFTLPIVFPLAIGRPKTDFLHLGDCFY